MDAVLHISGHSHQDNASDLNEPIFAVPVSCDGRSLQPGPGNAIKVRLDHGPMGHHWVNEFVNALCLGGSILIDNISSSSQAFVDSDGTLHAQLNVKVTQAKLLPAPPPMTPDLSDTWSQISTGPGGSGTGSSQPNTVRPVTSKKGKGKAAKPKDPNKPVYTSLRRGGR